MNKYCVWHVDYVCAVCNSLIEDREGSLWFHFAPVMSAVYQYGGRFLDSKPLSWRWRITHYTCGTRPSDGIMEIDVSKVRTHSQVLYITSAMFNESWFAHSSWGKVLDRFQVI
jgi:hypothetical protein